MKHLYGRIYKILIFVSLVATPLLAMGAPRGLEDPEEGARRVTQRGVIEINGCVIERDDLDVTASLLQSSAPSRKKDDDDDDDRDDSDSRAHRAFHAQIAATRDPHIFRFAIHGLSSRKAYVLNTDLRASCGKMTWMGPKRGVIVPVRNHPVRLQGFVLTTQIDVQTTDAAGNVTFRGADALTLASATRVFRWRTDLPGVTTAELQIAIDRFTSSADTPDTCANPSGLITRLGLPLNSHRENFTPPVDFNTLIFGNPGISAGTSSLIQFQVSHGAPLYVRVVPLDDAGTPRCDLLIDGAAAIAVLMYLPVQNAPSVVANPSLLISGDYTPALPVAFGSTCVRVVKFHSLGDSPDLLNLFWELEFQSAGDVHNGAIGKGVSLCLIPTTPSIFDDIGDFISGIIEGIAVLVDSLADLYNEIKQDVVKLVAAAIMQLGIDCGQGSPCQDAINTAVDTGLAALGLPPSLPNFQELVDQGVDYLADEAAEQSGLPVDQASDIIKQMITEAVNAQGGSGNALPDWLVYDNMFRPSLLVLNVTRPATLQPLPDDLLVLSSPGIYPLFGGFVKVPMALASTGSSTTIPIQLLPNLDGTADPQSICPFGPPSCQSLPKEFVLEFKLRDWYENSFLTTQCTRFDLDGVHLQTNRGEDLGTHIIFTQDPAHFAPGSSNTCN